jgi:phosphoribosylformylglycinamidine cyclo-ligase
MHTNGYSLARKVFQHWALNDRVAALGTNLGSALLAPHRSYLPEVSSLMEAGIDIHSLVHVTGGGLIDNPARVLPSGLTMQIDRSSWKIPPLFTLLRSQGNIETTEMYRTFNMGIGLLAVVPESQSDAALASIGFGARVVGRIREYADAPVELIG